MNQAVLGVAGWKNSGKSVKIGILTVSDRASRGEYEDRSGPAIEACLRKALASEWQSCDWPSKLGPPAVVGNAYL